MGSPHQARFRREEEQRTTMSAAPPAPADFCARKNSGQGCLLLLSIGQFCKIFIANRFLI
jgi:hypothetical protein